MTSLLFAMLPREDRTQANHVTVKKDVTNINKDLITFEIVTTCYRNSKQDQRKKVDSIKTFNEVDPLKTASDKLFPGGDSLDRHVEVVTRVLIFLCQRFRGNHY